MICVPLCLISYYKNNFRGTREAAQSAKSLLCKREHLSSAVFSMCFYCGAFGVFVFLSFCLGVVFLFLFACLFVLREKKYQVG